MIDYFTLALTHGLIAAALWRLLFRPDLDADEAAVSAPPARPWARDGTGEAGEEPRDA
ncbi:MAG TPA: hypothetical protein VEB68_08890 [Croceibacterium sp.]|nr:hypothetical protein [Croceibacterium sp.]